LHIYIEFQKSFERQICNQEFQICFE